MKIKQIFIFLFFLLLYSDVLGVGVFKVANNTLVIDFSNDNYYNYTSKIIDISNKYVPWNAYQNKFPVNDTTQNIESNLLQYNNNVAFVDFSNCTYSPNSCNAGWYSRPSLYSFLNTISLRFGYMFNVDTNVSNVLALYTDGRLPAYVGGEGIYTCADVLLDSTYMINYDNQTNFYQRIYSPTYLNDATFVYYFNNQIKYIPPEYNELGTFAFNKTMNNKAYSPVNANFSFNRLEICNRNYLTTLKNITIFSKDNVINIGNNSLPYVNISANPSTICVSNKSASIRFNTSINATDNEGDTIYYSGGEINRVTQGDSIVFTTLDYSHISQGEYATNETCKHANNALDNVYYKQGNSGFYISSVPQTGNLGNFLSNGALYMSGYCLGADKTFYYPLKSTFKGFNSDSFFANFGDRSSFKLRLVSDNLLYNLYNISFVRDPGNRLLIYDSNNILLYNNTINSDDYLNDILEIVTIPLNNSMQIYIPGMSNATIIVNENNVSERASILAVEFISGTNYNTGVGLAWIRTDYSLYNDIINFKTSLPTFTTRGIGTTHFLLYYTDNVHLNISYGVRDFYVNVVYDKFCVENPSGDTVNALNTIKTTNMKMCKAFSNIPSTITQGKFNIDICILYFWISVFIAIVGTIILSVILGFFLGYLMIGITPTIFGILMIVNGYWLVAYTSLQYIVFALIIMFGLGITMRLALTSTNASGGNNIE